MEQAAKPTTAITTPADSSAAPVASAEPESKKRKRTEASPVVAETSTQAAQTELSDKTIKRLRKNLSKLDAEQSARPLNEVLGLLGKGKKDQPALSADEVLRAVKVATVDGKVVLTV